MLIANPYTIYLVKVVHYEIFYLPQTIVLFPLLDFET
jgi:hypothetical protein